MTTLLDYQHPPAKPPKGGAGWFFLGIGSGLLISIVAWITLAKNAAQSSSGNAGSVMLLGLFLIPAIKCALGAAVWKVRGKSTFMSGIVTSIALAPLVGIGLVYAACANLI